MAEEFRWARWMRYAEIQVSGFYRSEIDPNTPGDLLFSTEVTYKAPIAEFTGVVFDAFFKNAIDDNLVLYLPPTTYWFRGLIQPFYQRRALSGQLEWRAFSNPVQMWSPWLFQEQPDPFPYINGFNIPDDIERTRYDIWPRTGGKFQVIAEFKIWGAYCYHYIWQGAGEAPKRPLTFPTLSPPTSSWLFVKNLLSNQPGTSFPQIIQG